MGDAHIGRRQAWGLGKETTPGTQVAAAVWMPKKEGTIKPVFEKAVDDSAYGVIDEVADSQTVKNFTEGEFKGILRDDWVGYLLLAAMGKVTKVKCITLASIASGTPARGDTVYVGSIGSETFIGTIKKIVLIGAVNYYFISTTSGTLVSADTLTNGTWTATATIRTGVQGHFFERLNNNKHPSFTLYASDPVAEEYATYCLLDNLELEIEVANYAMCSGKFRGKKLQTASAQSPAYQDNNPFLAKHGRLSFADNEAAINAATAVKVQRFKLAINKNLTDVQAFGDTDIDSIHNQQFNIAGDLDAIYTDTVMRNYVANSSKKASRIQLVNNEVTPLFTAGSAADNVYPGMYIDMARLSFEEWTRSSENNGLTNQTMGFAGEFKSADAMTLEILLLNANATGY